MVSVRETFQEDLTTAQLFEWHRMLMKGSDVEAGLWRTGENAMQVVSGRIDRPTVHFEAPPSLKVPHEMEAFSTRFNSSRIQGKSSLAYAPIRSGLAHLYFESIHPFEDGNGRMGRALSEKALSQGLGRPALLSLSQTIEANRKSYYQALEDAQRENEVTDWLCYFVGTVLEAEKDAEARIQLAVRKKNYFVCRTTTKSGHQRQFVEQFRKGHSSPTQPQGRSIPAALGKNPPQTKSVEQ
jgi:Fic family protein